MAKVHDRAAHTHSQQLLAQLKPCSTGPPWRTSLNVPIREALSRGVSMRSDWETAKEEVMRALREKFAQNPALRAQLLRTAPSLLQEASPHDVYWGVGPSGTGQNRLGVLLMQLRSDLAVPK